MDCKYLVRFDDICPTMNWNIWSDVEDALREYGARPVLAVVPENRDSELVCGDPDERFWERVREWQRRGWAIGLHGFEHRYVTRSAGLLGRNAYSEFAGLPEDEQDRKIRRAVQVFSANGVNADAWVAPAHSFDGSTVKVLARHGIRCISDGYSRFPYVCDEGLLWIPQQMARFRPMPAGVWTICLHVNNWTSADVAGFRRSLERYRGGLTSLQSVCETFGNRRRQWEDRVLFESFRMMRRLKRWRQR